MTENTHLTLQEIKEAVGRSRVVRSSNMSDFDVSNVIAEFQDLLGANGYRIQKVVQVETATERAQAG